MILGIRVQEFRASGWEFGVWGGLGIRVIRI